MKHSPKSSSDMNHDDNVRRAYRSATEGLNEAPSPLVRVTVLAAAARAVLARPTGVDANGAAPALRGRARYRIPFAAAASVLVGTIALLLAQRTDENMPAQGESTSVATRTDQAPSSYASAEPKAGKGDEVARPSTPSTTAGPADATRIRDADAPSAADRKTDAASRQRLAQAAGASDRRANDQRVQEPGALVGIAPSAKVLEGPAPASAEASAAASAAANESAKDRAAASTLGRVDAAEMQQAPKRESANTAILPRESSLASSAPTASPVPAREELLPSSAAEREARAPAAPVPLKKAARSDDFVPEPPPAAVPATDHVIARPVQRTAPVSDVPAAAGKTAQLQPAELPADIAAEPKRWLERIVRLRAERRHELADAELRSLRIRYPDVAVPPAALR